MSERLEALEHLLGYESNAHETSLMPGGAPLMPGMIRRTRAFRGWLLSVERRLDSLSLRQLDAKYPGLAQVFR